MPEGGHHKPVHHSRTASQVFGGEAVILVPAENKVFILNPVGSRIWELADGTRSPEHIALTLTEEFDVEPPIARQAVEGFLAELTGKELLTWI